MTTTAKRRMGRPPGPTGEAKEHIGIRLDRGDIEALDEMAAEQAATMPGATVTRGGLARAFIVAQIDAWRKRPKAKAK